MITPRPLKVYELAKELGMDSLSLVQRLKKMNFAVKSHMSALTPEVVSQAKTALLKKKKHPSRKKKTRSKAVAAPKKNLIIRRKAKKASPAPAPTSSVIKEKDLTSSETTMKPSKASAVASKKKEETKTTDVCTTQKISAPTATATPSVPTKKLQKAPIAKPVSIIETPKSLLRLSSISKKKPLLKKVASTQKEKKPSSLSTQKTPAKRVFKMNKEALVRMMEQEKFKKRGAGRSQPQKPKAIRMSDYRKKEVLYLRKKKKPIIGRPLKKTKITTPKDQKRIIELENGSTVENLAHQLHIKTPQLIRKLIELGQKASPMQFLDIETATLLAAEYRYEIRNVTFQEKKFFDLSPDPEKDLKERPPIVTVMGHVDHGKTTLLDTLRKTKVAAHEAGGITQHVGAYQVEVKGKKITFIDTPGHETFTLMRARGAQTTDMVVLVVAADDGVMAQTREALDHAQAAKVPILVAINKIDKPEAQPERVKQALSELGLVPEDWGGDTLYIPISALKNQNLDQLLESILLQSELLELKTNPKARASGTILEAKIEKGRGILANAIVKRGTLKTGDTLVVGTCFGKVRSLMDSTRTILKSAPPSTPVAILGLEALPQAGQTFYVTESEADAKKVIQYRIDQKKRDQIQAQKKRSIESLFQNMQSTKELHFIIKADTFGTCEAIRTSLEKLSTEKVKANVLHANAGGINESDVLLAEASQALILGFTVRPETKARRLAEEKHIEIDTFSVIYELIDAVKKRMQGLLDKKRTEKYLGRAEVRQTFHVSKVGTIAGCLVVDGKILRSAQIRILRDQKIIHEGTMVSLKHFKDDVKEIGNGMECGLRIEHFDDIKTGDVIEAFEIILEEATLEE